MEAALDGLVLAEQALPKPIHPQYQLRVIVL